MSLRADWVTQMTKVVDHFKGRVRRYEVINEPNALDGSGSFVNPPDVIAALLADFYTSLKLKHPGDACWNVDVISGGLAGGQSDADVAGYLQQVYAAGTGHVFSSSRCRRSLRRSVRTICGPSTAENTAMNAAIEHIVIATPRGSVPRRQ